MSTIGRTAVAPAPRAGRPRARAGAWGALAVLALLALARTAPGAESASPPPAPLPDPIRLSADWWRYFEVGGDTLTRRVKAFDERLAKLSAGLPAASGDTQNTPASLIAEILTTLPRYAALKARRAPPPPPATPIAERYSIQRLIELASRRREAKLELALQKDEATRQAQALKSARSELDDFKAKYLALAADAPQRLQRGLRLIRDRIASAVGEEDLRLRRAVIAARDAEVAHLNDEMKAASVRLYARPADRETFRAAAAQAHDEAVRLGQEAAVVRLRGGANFEQGDVARAEARQQAQRLIDYEVRIAHAELQESAARLSDALAAYLMGPDQATLEGLRAKRKASADRLAGLPDLMERWRRATSRERTAAASQLALVSPKDKRLTDIHRQRIHRADKTEQALNRLEEEQARTDLLVKVAGERVIEGGGRFRDYLDRTLGWLSTAWTAVKRWSTASLFEINDTPVTLLGLLRVVLIVVIAWWVSAFAREGLDRVMQRRDSMSRASLYTLKRLSHYVIILIGFFVALSSIGIDFTKFALIVSALGVGLGFGLQAIFSNFVAGLIILFEKSLKVGDYVELESGVNGEVKEINIRSTLITTNDNIDILVPNSEFVSGRVINWTLREAYRRIRVPFGVAYGTDKELVRSAVLDAADGVPFTLKSIPGRHPQVWLVGFGDNSLNFELVVWLTPEAVVRPATVQAAYTWAIHTALEKNGIEIPFPQRDLHLRSLFGHRDVAAVDLLRGAPPPPPEG